MKNNFLQEIFVSIILIVLLVLLLNPFELWMPPIFLMMMVLGLVVVFSLFASFIWRENAKDEREGLHKMMAGRIAFLAGTATLVIGIIAQSFRYELDFWLVLTLGVMILAKIIGLLHGREAGADIIKTSDGKTVVKIREARLYKIIQGNKSETHTLKFIIPESGLNAFAFTFG